MITPHKIEELRREIVKRREQGFTFTQALLTLDDLEALLSLAERAPDTGAREKALEEAAQAVQAIADNYAATANAADDDTRPTAANTG